jgi:hypothetical protein
VPFVSVLFGNEQRARKGTGSSNADRMVHKITRRQKATGRLLCKKWNANWR